jgi:hypothetical protein
MVSKEQPTELIQDGKVIYARGFGVRNIETREPLTLNTVYRIGSTSKSYTSMLAAMDVDAGRFDWDTLVHSLRSYFRLPNAIRTLGGYVERWLRAFPFPTCWTRTVRL